MTLQYEQMRSKTIEPKIYVFSLFAYIQVENLLDAVLPAGKLFIDTPVNRRTQKTGKERKNTQKQIL